MIKNFLEHFHPPSAEELAQRELDDDKRSLLEAQRQRDYFTKMVEFYDMRVRTLTSQLKKAAEAA